MLANKILLVFLTIIGYILLPAQVVTNVVLRILGYLTCGLLLLPLDFIWTIFLFGPLVGLSCIYERLLFLRPLISLIGVPLVLISDIYVSLLLPPIDAADNRLLKLLYGYTFPYTCEFREFYAGKQKVSQNLLEILRRFDRSILYRALKDSPANFDDKESAAREEL